jgi:hypothetical protein
MQRPFEHIVNLNRIDRRKNQADTSTHFANCQSVDTDVELEKKPFHNLISRTHFLLFETGSTAHQVWYRPDFAQFRLRVPGMLLHHVQHRFDVEPVISRP